jgi:alkyl hydroperoxide reductase subunit F
LRKKTIVRLEERLEDRKQKYSAIILGGGPAGLGCALELVNERETNFILLEASDSIGGQLRSVTCPIRNLGGAYYQDARDLLRSMILSVERFAVPCRTNANVTMADLANRRVYTGAGVLEAENIAIATGVRAARLSAEYDEGLAGRIIYRVEGREPELWNRNVTVCGGGDNAAIEALAAASHSSTVTVVSRSPLRARPDLVQEVTNHPNVRVLTGFEVAAVRGSGRIEAVELRSRATGQTVSIASDCVVAQLGSLPNTELFAGQARLDDRGHIIVDKHMRTSAPGVYAAGDVTDSRYLRLGPALGAGVAVACEILRSIRMQT